MKSRINARLLLIAALAIILTAVMSTVICYHQFEEEVLDGLKAEARVIQNTDAYQSEAALSKIKRIRVTLIDSSGNVLYDNQMSASSMDNHKSRPEVAAAMKDGEGESIRKSSTVSSSMFYYAMKLDNQQIIRVAKESDSIWSVYQKALPVIALIAAALFGLCILLSHFLTKTLIQPVEKMAKNPNRLKDIHTYKELMPFITLIQKQREDLIQNASMRQEFTANVSHELKTPLTAISGYAELIASGMSDPEETKRFSGEIKRNAQRLLVLINDTIRLSELDVSEEDVSLEPVDLYQIASDCLKLIAVQAEKAEIQVTVEGEHLMALTNKTMTEEIVYNLCDNAVRYNSPGGMVIIETYHKREDIFLTVKDNGIGISKENQSRIFERFYRVDKSRSKRTGGTGLGLAIVKHLAEKCEIIIKLESEEGIGTLVKLQFQTVTPGK